VIVVSVAGFWQDAAREVAVIAGLVLLTWVSALHVPRLSVPVLTRLASASLAVYLTHWLVYPPLERWPLVALVVSLGVGVTAYEAFRLAMNAAKSRSFWSAYASAYSAKDRSARSLLPR
jgi:peptidoglycan/LPS O-acetylase OafA/YrhL